MGSSQDLPENAFTRTRSASQSEPLLAGQLHQGTSPSTGLARPAARPHQSTSTSPAAQSLPGLHSPLMVGHHSPPSASSRSVTLNRETSSETNTSTIGHNPRERYAETVLAPLAHHGYVQPSHSTTPPALGFGLRAPRAVNVPPRRTSREATTLPPLTREGSTLSSESSGGTRSNVSYSGSLVPVLDAPKELRGLPKPRPSQSHTALSKQRAPPVPTTNCQDVQYSLSSLDALIRAGELARIAEDKLLDDASPP